MASPDAASVQTVKLKVLYTFDIDSRDNHLTRWPQSVQVNTCYIDNVNQIGAIDLRTCLEAVTTASPELTSTADTDYTVYAYDYSEEDTPLVGQGMLSKHLGEDMDSENEAMVTGRVTKALMGLLTKNAQPTLEVKLRLKPVATSMGRARSGSFSSQDGRPAWLQNPEALQRSASPMDTTGLENMQRMLSEGGPTRDRSDMYAHSRPGSRAGTPGLPQTYDQSLRPSTEDYPRPDSRASMRQVSHTRRDSFSGYYSGDEMMEEGPAKKRAKTMKVNQISKASFNIEKQPDDLRAMAGKANSVRLHRPTPVHPSGFPTQVFANEEPVRPPTPVPTKTGRPRGRPRNSQKHALSSMNTLTRNSSSSNEAVRHESAEAILSPEDIRARSVSSTPANIPSSPPVMLNQMPTRTSPTLPPMRDTHDSGLGSGDMDDDIFGANGLVQFDDFDLDKAGDMSLDFDFGQFDNPPNNGILSDATKAQQGPTSDVGHDVPQGQQEPTVGQPRFLAPARPIERSQSFATLNRPGPSMSSPKLAPAPFPRARQINEEQEARLSNSRNLPKIAASDPVGPTLQRAQTWAPDSDAIMSEAPAEEADGEAPKRKSKKKVGKDQTKARLEAAIAAGNMPPFCDNCGVIETPAWRRGYAKVFDNVHYDDVETGLAPGDVVYKHALDYKDDGSIKSFRGYKVDKSQGDDTDGWQQICLCNPCGLWFHKQKCPRPKEKWARASKQTRRRRNPKGGPKAEKKTPGAVNPRSDMPTPASDDSSPTDTNTEAPDGYDNDDDMQGGEDENTDGNEPQLPPMPRDMRSNSLGPATQVFQKASKASQSQRQVQSSPTMAPRHSDDLEGDLTPKPLRRQLFPSPNKPPSAPASTHSSAQARPVLMPSFVRRSPRLTKTKDVFQIPGVAGAVAITADGKENLMPELVADHSTMSMEGFFEEMIDESVLPPSTPQRRSGRLLSRTPQRSFGEDVSANVQRSPLFRTPKAKQTQHPVAAAFLGSVMKDMSEMTPFTRQIAEAFNTTYMPTTLTPGRIDKGHKKATPPKNVNFDFPDLPSLPGSSPSNNGAMYSVNFSELPTDIQTDLGFSTDAPMPSSPPIDFLHLLDPEGHNNGQSLDDWSHMDMGPNEKSSYPDPSALDASTALTPRRSPRHAR